MKFLKLDKKKGSGGPAIKSRYAFLIYLDDIAYLPPTNDKGVRMEGDILLKENCTMMPLYLTSSSQEFSYDTLGDDDEKSYKVKFSGNHPGTELEALEFAKNMIEQPFLVLIPACNPADPWKLLGEITNPLIFTSSHKATKDSSRFTFNFEQRIGSEYIYFSYGGVEVPSSGEGADPPSGGFDPTKWARVDASNIDDHVAAWREKLGIGGGSIKNYPTLSDFPIPGDIATIYKALDTDELYVWDAETETYILSSIDDVWKMAVDQGIASALTTLSGVLEEMADIQLNKANKDASEMSPANIISWQEALNIHNLQIALDAEIVNRALADNNLQNQINTNNTAIADLNIHSIEITTGATSITTNTTDSDGRTQNGREVAIKNGVNAINITCEISSSAKFLASYTKEGSGPITILAGTGATKYESDGTNVVNGIKGSTFCIKRSGNEFQIQISNR